VHHGARSDLDAALAPAALGVTSGCRRLGGGARAPAPRTKQSSGLAQLIWHSDFNGGQSSPTSMQRVEGVYNVREKRPRWKLVFR